MDLRVHFASGRGYVKGRGGWIKGEGQEGDRLAPREKKEKSSPMEAGAKRRSTLCSDASEAFIETRD